MMETATLTSPPRPVMVQPVQKSLSLPSYARSSGEGIDHKLIFAALEQREKVRRKSKIFKDKEKSGSTRQNYFCLPLPSNNKCRETSLSSDTSCSSLEFQKPKKQSSPEKTRKEVSNVSVLQNGVTHIKVDSSHCVSREVQHSITRTCDDNRNILYSPNCDDSLRKATPTSIDVSRSTIGSSDSMERTDKSSKSSTDSIGRKERLVAIKARVEAEREKKLGDSSSDEETSLRITRHNSDGIIHRTVREVKAKSSRSEKHFKRRAQEDSAARRATRRQHTTSLFLPSTTTDLESWSHPLVRSGSSFNLQHDLEDLNPGEFYSVLRNQRTTSTAKENYFSDICSSRSQLVKQKVETIEAMELKHRVQQGDGNKNKNLVTSIAKKESGYFIENKCYDGSNKSTDIGITRQSSTAKCDDSTNFLKKYRPFSPITRAPTPPPRSPKSIDFVNRALIQHQNVTNSLNESHSLERQKPYFHPNISVGGEQEEELKSPSMTKNSSDAVYKNVMAMRRKTCTSFSQFDESSFGRSKTPTRVGPENKIHAPLLPPKSPDLSQKFHDLGRKPKERTFTPDVNTSKISHPLDTPTKKWGQLEMNSEKKFNSLENNGQKNIPVWSKWQCLPRRKQCLCFTKLESSGCPYHCPLKEDTYPSADSLPVVMKRNDSPILKKPTESNDVPSSNSFPLCKSSFVSDRLTKSEANLSSTLKSQTQTPNVNIQRTFNSKPSTQSNSHHSFSSQFDASFSLDTAMEELESVYKSLRMSCESLSETRDTEDKISNLENLYNSSTRSPHEHLSRHSDSPKHTLDKFTRVPPKKEHSRRSSLVPSEDNMTKELITEVLCLNELFSNLTHQLDMEQKLLEESKAKKLQESPHQRRSTTVIKHPVPFTVEKEETLPVSSTCKVTTIIPTFKANEQQFEESKKFKESALMKKRKQKAVRSISENLAQFIQINSETNSLASSCDREKKTNRRCEMNSDEDPSISVCETSQTCLNSLEATNENNGEIVNCYDSRYEVLPQSKNGMTQHKADSDEIWQVRVSMGSGTPPEDDLIPSHKAEDSTYKRLRCALRRPSTADIGTQGTVRSPLPPRCPPAVPLNENELETMLTTLLSDVSNSPLTDRTTTSQILSKGEMLVMRHLDAIRNHDHIS